MSLKLEVSCLKLNTSFRNVIVQSKKLSTEELCREYLMFSKKYHDNVILINDWKRGAIQTPILVN